MNEVVGVAVAETRDRRGTRREHVQWTRNKGSRGGDDRKGGRLKSGTRHTVVCHVQGFGEKSIK